MRRILPVLGLGPQDRPLDRSRTRLEIRARTTRRAGITISCPGRGPRSRRWRRRRHMARPLGPSVRARAAKCRTTMLCAPLSAGCVAGFRVGPGGQASLKMPRLETLDYARRERSGGRGGNGGVRGVDRRSRRVALAFWIWLGRRSEAVDRSSRTRKRVNRRPAVAKDAAPTVRRTVSASPSSTPAPRHPRIPEGSARAPVGGPDTDRELVDRRGVSSERRHWTWILTAISIRWPCGHRFGQGLRHDWPQREGTTCIS